MARQEALHNLCSGEIWVSQWVKEDLELGKITLCFSPVQANKQLHKVEESFPHKPIGDPVSPDRDWGVLKWSRRGRSNFQSYDIQTASISRVNVRISQNINLWLNRWALISPKLRKKAWFIESGLDGDLQFKTHECWPMYIHVYTL